MVGSLRDGFHHLIRLGHKATQLRGQTNHCPVPQYLCLCRSVDARQIECQLREMEPMGIPWTSQLNCWWDFGKHQELRVPKDGWALNRNSLYRRRKESEYRRSTVRMCVGGRVRLSMSNKVMRKQRWLGISSWNMICSPTFFFLETRSLSVALVVHVDPSWPQIHRDSPVSASQVLGLKTCHHTWLSCQNL